MDTMIAGSKDRSLHRFEDPTSAGGAKKGAAVRRSPLTNRDIEAEVLVRLAHKGYDWTGMQAAKSTEGAMKKPKRDPLINRVEELLKSREPGSIRRVPPSRVESLATAD